MPVITRRQASVAASAIGSDRVLSSSPISERKAAAKRPSKSHTKSNSKSHHKPQALQIHEFVERANDLKEKYTKNRLQIVEKHKKEMSRLREKLLDITEQQLRARIQGHLTRITTFTKHTHARKEIEKEIVDRLNGFRIQMRNMALRVEVTLEGRAGELAEYNKIQGSEKTA